MRFYLLLTIFCLLFTSTYAQEQFLGKSKADILAECSQNLLNAVDSRQYPLIKETLKLENVTRWYAKATVYLFFDSSDHVCRVHYIFEKFTPKARQTAVDELKGKVKNIQDLSDKKLVVYSGQDATTDYMLTWAKNKHATYYLLTTKEYKQRMLNVLIKGIPMPDDGIFSPAPLK